MMTLTTPPFRTVLVANRGEIARRVIRTLRRLGIRSVAVYSDADAMAPHVHEADAAVRLGPAPAAESYLDIDAVIAAARASGAEAIHPGYGFLSENVAFGHACAAAGLVFIGPGEEALDVMGDKIRAKEHVAASGVPTVPGFSARGLDDEEIRVRALDVGFPLLVKPSAGGGGKGMQVVRDAAELEDALVTARRVAAASFGDDSLLLERLIERPRHIEVQIFADRQGNVIHLGERECTLQRRHQKVVEEAPSPLIDDATRERIGAAACRAAASVDYVGAGTVEFLVAADRPEEFFFIEMNTRLQVEHPVTEMVTGLDLVDIQLRVAAGEPLPLAQDDVVLTGHAVEARVYAESPARGFLPATGDVLLWRTAEHVRTDSAVETGSAVTADYDPMIAKVIAWAADREAAVARLSDALADTVLLGVDSNIGFLRSLLNDERVRAGDMDTGLIDRLPAYRDPAPTLDVLRAAAAAVPSQAELAPAGPWRALSGFRLGLPEHRGAVTLIADDGEVHTVPLDTAAPASAAFATDAEGGVWAYADGTTARFQPIGRRELGEKTRSERDRAPGSVDPALKAPMPGNVVAVHPGGVIAAGERVVVIEAMKMEHPVLAPADGTVTVDARVGDHVRRDQIVAHFSHQQSEESA
ncbi:MULTISPECIES: biotin carboxylase N-terminal domain-containing protein [Microbacterium]|uniref:acetyl/propionyl/methylcrotonyl-CoA carboxylase subunit alpha n=1 Tax=Microbacterium TaxID=33882 RepID=UPI001E4D01E0|nr:biotin carboxylase N-terminal domain-containing protein [Microbacterium nymphoidis]MCD2497331.1 ATP-grasp domain-containing protein [Microbacterium nymphoidis]